MDVVILLQDGEGNSSAFQRGQTNVGRLSADDILTGQSPVELHLMNQITGDQSCKCGSLMIKTRASQNTRAACNVNKPITPLNGDFLLNRNI